MGNGIHMYGISLCNTSKNKSVIYGAHFSYFPSKSFSVTIISKKAMLLQSYGCRISTKGF